MARSPVKRESFRGKLAKETISSWTASLRPDSPPAISDPAPAPPRRPRVPSHIVPRRSSSRSPASMMSTPASKRSPALSTPASKLFARVVDESPASASPEAHAAPLPPRVRWRELRTADGRPYFCDASTGEVRWDDPDAAYRTTGVWTEATTPDGQTYFYHTGTLESSWADPARADAAWARSRTPEGFEFWYHTSSGETSWEPPS